MARQPGGARLKSRMMRVAALASSVRELRQAQAVLLPLLGLSLKDTALVTGMSVSWVAKQRADAIRTEALQPPGAHGGRRRVLFPSLKAEREYVAALRGDTAPVHEECEGSNAIAALLASLDAQTFTVSELQRRLQQALGRPVSRSGALGFGRRHGLVRRLDEKPE